MRVQCAPYPNNQRLPRLKYTKIGAIKTRAGERTGFPLKRSQPTSVHVQKKLILRKHDRTIHYKN